MALRASGILSRSNFDHLGSDDRTPTPKRLSSICRIRGNDGMGLWGCGWRRPRRIRSSVCCLIRAEGGEEIVRYENGIGEKSDGGDDLVGGRLQRKELGSLPKPLSVTDLSANSNCGSEKLRVAFKGLPGAYGEDAALKAYPHCTSVPCDEFEEAFKAVELWLADKAVLPIENSLGGSIHRNYDLLLRHTLHIVGEVQLPVELCLMALPGVQLDDLKRVLSHPQALADCDRLLSKLGVARENVDDVASAAQFVPSNGLKDAGVIATSRTSRIYGLHILAEGVQDNPDSVTRFLVLARNPVMPRADKAFKTSIVFALEEGSGVLFKALAVFALREINLTKIESRPQRKRPLRLVDDSDNGSFKYFDYLFYIDFEASMAEPRAQNALAHVQDFATFLRVLGCYPVDAL
ncbi:Arogenate dehydratase/prephenate dehydratase 1, chloroplastic-like protein [Drosera capensis]